MAVVNHVAPEHLELITADPEALVPLVRHAGAVFLGPLAPASIGDYVAGPSHVLPTFGSARFGSALTVDDFTKQVHVIDVDREPASPRPPPWSPPSPTPRASPPTPSPSGSVERRLGGPTGAGVVIRPRDDVALMEGYHSPQVDVDVRLNTNESPERAPAGVDPASWPRRSGRSTGTATPTAPATRAAGRHRRAPRRRARAGVRRQRLQRGAPDPAAHLRRGRGAPPRCGSPPTPCTPTSPGSPAPAVAEGERADDFSIDLDEVRRVVADASSRPSPSCARPTTPPAWSTTRPPSVPRSSWSRGVDGLLVVDEAYGQFAPWSALGLVDDDVPLVVTRTFSKTWSMAAARLGYLVGPAEVVPSSRRSCCRTTSTPLKQAAGMPRPRPRRRHGRPRRPPGRGARPAGRPPRPSCPSRCGPRAPTSCCSARPVTDGDGRVAGAASTGRSSSATARRGPASRAASGSPSARPTEDDAFLAALRGDPVMSATRHRRRPPRRDRRPHHQRDRHRHRARPRRRRPGRDVAPACRSSTTCSPSSAATAGSTSSSGPPATSRSTPTTRSRTSASPWARCSARPWATRPGCAASPRTGCRSTRPSSTWPSTCRAGPSSLYEVEFPARRSWATRPSTRSWSRSSGGRSSPPPPSPCTSPRCAGATPTTSSRPRSRPSPGPCATRCGSRAGVPSTKGVL